MSDHDALDEVLGAISSAYACCSRAGGCVDFPALAADVRALAALSAPPTDPEARREDTAALLAVLRPLPTDLASFTRDVEVEIGLEGSSEACFICVKRGNACPQHAAEAAVRVFAASARPAAPIGDETVERAALTHGQIAALLVDPLEKSGVVHPGAGYDAAEAAADALLAAHIVVAARGRLSGEGGQT